MIDVQQIKQLATDTINIETQALVNLQQNLIKDDSLVQAVELILGSSDYLIVMGMGKSGHVGRKIAATLSSTGTATFFVHPGEASHGDLGMIKSQTVVLVISNGGESEEIINLLPVLKRLQVKIIVMTGKNSSTLAKHADVVLDSSVTREACPLNLAPTSSTTVQMVIGDVLSAVLLDARGFKAEDFAFSHPGGLLGRQLLTHIVDVMRTQQQLPLVSKDDSLLKIMKVIGAKGIGAAFIVDDKQRLLGIFTDGDLRRLLETGQSILDFTVGDVMHQNPKTINKSALAAQAANMMEEFRISCIAVVDEQQILCGVVTSNDLMRAKVI